MIIKKFSHFIFIITFSITLAIILTLAFVNANKHYDGALLKLQEQGLVKLDNQLSQIEHSLSILIDYTKAVGTLSSHRPHYDEGHISTIFKNLFIKEMGIFQLRLLDEKGKELIRYELNEDNNIIKSTHLQDKSTRYYFKEAKLLKPQEIYISKLDLNEENGKIEKPYKKTIRILEKIEIDHIPYYLAINYDLSKVLQTALNSTLYTLFFIEKSGEINMHLDDNYAFSKQRHKKIFLKDFLQNRDQYIAQKKLKQLPYEVVITLKKSKIEELEHQKVATITKMIFIALLIALTLSSVLYYFLNRHLKKLTHNVYRLMRDKKVLYPAKFKEFENILQKVSRQQLIIKKHISELTDLQNSLEDKVKKQVDEIRQKEQQLIQQSRLAQMGEVISMIAHQWRQPLSIISTTTANLSFKLQLSDVDKEECLQEITYIDTHAQQLSKIIDDFSLFFKLQEEKKSTSLDEIVINTLKIVKISAENREIKLITSLHSQKTFHTYSNELQQALLNIIKNSEETLLKNHTNNPTIMIETKSTQTAHILKVSDNGGGISKEIIEKIFDPYFSTKLEKNGVGLGLYISKMIVEKHCQGTLEVTNTPTGACFTITIEG